MVLQARDSPCVVGSFALCCLVHYMSMPAGWLAPPRRCFACTPVLRGSRRTAAWLSCNSRLAAHRPRPAPHALTCPQMRGTVSAANPWDVMVDMFFYREPGELYLLEWIVF